MDIDDAYDPEVDYTAIPLPPTNTTPTPSQQPPQPPQEEERTLLPGQKNFAQRLMAKYGWTKGTGLGATESGITTALRVHVEKRRRKPDSEGGGFAGPGGRGRVIAPKMGKPKPTSTSGGVVEGGAAAGEGRFGKSSVVVVLDQMLDNLADLESEVEAGLGQEIGEECGERYGRVERIVVDVEGRRVFIRFVEGVSALRVSIFDFLFFSVVASASTSPCPLVWSGRWSWCVAETRHVLTWLDTGCQCARGQDIQRECDRREVL
jgi:hypothetical protein